jgi:hypothetical protein
VVLQAVDRFKFLLNLKDFSMITTKYLCVIAVVLFYSTASLAVTRYRKIEDSTATDNGNLGWGSCIDCAGGGSNNATISSSPFQTSPSLDGASRDFLISGDAYSNGLWWNKLGPNNSAANFSFDFWINVSSSTQAAQALEFDTFQFISGHRYMFGTQCNYAAGVWDIWNESAIAWVHTKVPCKKFLVNTWYHITSNFHRTSPDNLEHYDNLTITQYKSSGRIAANSFYLINKTFPSGMTPSGWGDNLGIQFQMDIGPIGAQMQEWVDQVSLTAW